MNYSSNPKLSKSLSGVFNYNAKKTITSLKSLINNLNKSDSGLSAGEKKLAIKTIKRLNRDPHAVVSKKMAKTAIQALEGSGALSSEFKNKHTRAINKLKNFSDEGKDEIGPLMKKRTEEKEEENKKNRILGRRRLSGEEGRKNNDLVFSSKGFKEMKKSKVSIGQVVQEKNRQKKEDKSAIDLPID